jgi:hypothetical protein
MSLAKFSAVAIASFFAFAGGFTWRDAHSSCSPPPARATDATRGPAVNTTPPSGVWRPTPPPAPSSTGLPRTPRTRAPGAPTRRNATRSGRSVFRYRQACEPTRSGAFAKINRRGGVTSTVGAAALRVLADALLCQSVAATRFLSDGARPGAECCSIAGACTGDWSTRGSCAWAKIHQAPLLRVPDWTTNKIDTFAPSMLGLPPGACLMHKDVPPAAFSATWLDQLVNTDGRVLGVVGASHQRQIMMVLDPMIQKVRRGTAFKLVGGVPYAVWDPKTRAVFARYFESRDGDVDIDALVAAGATDVLFGRGMWDVLSFDTPLEDVRVQTQIVLAEIRRRLPGARITVYPTHFAHWNRDGCLSVERQLLYRDAVVAAVHNVNTHLLPSDAFRATSDALNASDPAASLAFSDPIRVLDVLEMTATPEARRCSDVLAPAGNHYCTAVLINIVARWLLGDNVAVRPAATRDDSDIDVGRWAPVPRRTAPKPASPARSFYRRALSEVGFHRYGLLTAAARSLPCNECRRFTEYYMKRRTDRNIKFEVQEECPRMHRRMRASCLDPVDYVLFNPDKDVRAYLDGDSLACTRDALVARGLLNASVVVVPQNATQVHDGGGSVSTVMPHVSPKRTDFLP